MATEVKTASQYTLLELANRKDPKGNTIAIAEVLATTNAILQDAPWFESNDTFSHRMARRLSLPAGTWRQLNAGVPVETSRTVNVTETIGFLESYSQVDKKLADNASDKNVFRMSEAAAFIEGMGQTLASALIYGNSNTDPEKITGLAPRLDATATNVISSSGTGTDLTSIYLVDWGMNGAFLLYPKGSPTMGVTHHDLGQVTLDDGSGNYWEGYRDHFEVNVGLAVKDDARIGRVCNIESAGSTSTFDEDKLIQLINFMPQTLYRPVIYVNETVKTQMEIKLKDKANVNFTTAEGLGGVPILRFRGIPVKRVDAIVNTESAVS